MAAQSTTNDAALLALAFVEALILENGHEAQTIARATDPADVGDMFYTVSKILAALLDSTYGKTGAIERIHRWRHIYLNPEEAPEWVE